jgi:hypothetical protein
MRRLLNGTYHFRCRTCGAEGELIVPPEMREPFGCPEQCGTTYVQYRAYKELHLRCVTWPLVHPEALPVWEDTPQKETP